MRDHKYYTYILTNKGNQVLYTGITNNLNRRLLEHKAGLNGGFTSRYKVDKLVYFEIYKYVTAAIKREKQIKGYSRSKKVALINLLNPLWKDLSESIL